MKAVAVILLMLPFSFVSCAPMKPHGVPSTPSLSSSPFLQEILKQNPVIEVVSYGADSEQAICREFRLTPKQAREFFYQAQARGGDSSDSDENPLFSCFVEGLFRTPEGQQYPWVIYVGGNAIVRKSEHEKVALDCAPCADRYVGD